MKQNRLNKRLWPYKGRARPNKAGLTIILAAIVALIILSLSESFATEPAKAKVQPIKKKSQAASTEAEPVSEKLKQAGKKEDQPAAQIKPVEPQQREIQPAPAAPKAGEEINWEVISRGGTDGGSASFKLTGTVDQTATGYASSASFQLNQGFWQSLQECPGRGDANGDGIIDIGDVIYLINYLFTGTSAPDPLCVGDCNCDGIVDIGDVIYLINYLFTGTSPPGC